MCTLVSRGWSRQPEMVEEAVVARGLDVDLAFSRALEVELGFLRACDGGGGWLACVRWM